MTGARDQILHKIRKTLARAESGETAERELAARLSESPLHTQPVISEELVDRFLQKLECAAASYARVHQLSRAPEAVQDFLDAWQLERSVIVAPALGDLPWPQDLRIHFGTTDGKDRTSVTPCFAAVAETGSLVLLSGASTPTRLNFLPDNHIVITQTSQVVRHIEDVWAQVRQHSNGFPRAVNYITGPSRTADIEQTIQLGAHGPRRLHVILVG